MVEDIVLTTPVDLVRALGEQRAERFRALVAEAIEEHYPGSDFEHRIVPAVRTSVEVRWMERREREAEEIERVVLECAEAAWDRVRR